MLFFDKCEFFPDKRQSRHQRPSKYYRVLLLLLSAHQNQMVKPENFLHGLIVAFIVLESDVQASKEEKYTNSLNQHLTLCDTQYQHVRQYIPTSTTAARSSWGEPTPSDWFSGLVHRKELSIVNLIKSSKLGRSKSLKRTYYYCFC